MTSYTLLNAAKMNKDCPDTFDIPPLNVRRTVKEGGMVKLEFLPFRGPRERMWVKTTNELSLGLIYEGVLANTPINEYLGLEYGDKVYFGPSCILAVE